MLNTHPVFSTISAKYQNSVKYSVLHTEGGFITTGAFYSYEINLIS